MSKLRCFTVYWSDSTESVKIDYPYQFQLEYLKGDGAFAAADRILVLDALRDTIYELQKLYDETLAIQPRSKHDHQPQEKIMKEEVYAAFPSRDNRVQFSGMDLRDYFAAQAMHAFIDKDEWQSTLGDVSNWAAENAYAMADAMIRMRK